MSDDDDEVPAERLSAVAELVTAASAVFQPWRDELTGNWMRAPGEARATALKILNHCERFVGRTIGGQA